jgi:1,4-alpha-glucan branching enzyme
MILTQTELDSLIQVQLRSPHTLLGMHPLGDGSGVVVRAFLPNAAQVEVVPTLEKKKPRLKLERLHDSGLYEGATKEANKVYAYDLVITDY